MLRYLCYGDEIMPVSEKQKGYSRKWDKDNMRTLATRVRTDVAEDFKKYCEEKGTSCTSEVKRLIEAALEEWYKELEEREKQDKK